MLRVAAGELPETLRLARPGRIVAFGKRDAVAQGYAAAVQAARDGGFEAIERLAGGRAAVFHEDTIAFAHAIPDADPRSGRGPPLRGDRRSCWPTPSAAWAWTRAWARCRASTARARTA